MGTNLQESVNWFKLMNGILNIKGSITLCEVFGFYKLHMLDDNLVSSTFCLSDIE